MTAYLDAVVGNITKEIKALGLWDQMLVLGASDNGGPIQSGQAANNHPLRSGKLTSWEGGLRVNAFVSGGVLPESVRGTQSIALVHTCDFYATVADAAQVDPTDHVAAAAGLPPVDSISIWPIINGSQSGSLRSELYVNGVYHDSSGFKLMTGKHSSAVWTGPQYPNASTDSSAITGRGLW